jgi:acyl-CoA synthetase (AMP-forming)/AMP-acid ligase II
VERAVVVGVPDPEWGERVVAVVVPGAGQPPKEAELDRFARDALAPAKRPKALRFLDAIPLNPNGKVDREGIRSIFR